ncbi:MAG: T9SS type A sorting domain-containing protein [Bacteroidales bacterium]|nr:T9SS type A sorting domain-containing protein [Bacteroidales bacterium]MCF8454676.1 T9SS type A sorting domain-containing protein [Bacteroidales bacterium]
MKNSTLILLLAIPLAFIGLTASVAYQNGSPGGKTGSPGDGGSTCVECHSGVANAVNGWITTDIPVEGYEVDGLYAITLTGTHAGAGKIGFELTAENSSGQKIGTLMVIDPVETQLASGGASITHTANGTTPVADSHTWNMRWLAPSQDEGTITFYAAINGANGNGNNSGDVIYTTSTSVDYTTLSINQAAFTENRVYPNPAANSINVVMNKAKHLDVLDFSGKIVRSFEMKSASERIDISDLESGTYFIQSEDGTERFIKL